MWFLISILVLLWFIGIITFGFTAYWVHGLLVVAVVLGVWNMLASKVISIGGKYEV